MILSHAISQSIISCVRYKFWLLSLDGNRGKGYTLVRDYTKKDAYETHALIADILGIDGGKPISEADRKAWAATQAERESAEKQAKKKHGKPLPKPPKTALTPPPPSTPTPILPKKAYARTVLG